MEDSKSTPPSDSSEAHLLGIAPELRNAIYTYALVEDDKIQYNKSNFKQPGLLCVNRQIRSEASPIYYQLNTFVVGYKDFNCSGFKTIHRQRKDWITYSDGIEKQGSGLWALAHCKTAKPKWENVIEWARALHADEVGNIPISNGTETPAVQMALTILDMTYDLLDLPWETAKRILQTAKVVSEQKKIAWK